MENKTLDTIAEVKDLQVASYLYATQIVKIVGNKRLSNGTVLIQFSPKDKVEKLISLYWNLQAPPIQPKVLLNAQRDVKDLIFSP